MIAVSYWKNEDIRRWYCDSVIKKISNKRREVDDKYHNNYELDFFYEIKNMSYDLIRDIISKPREELACYEWIDEYLRLADFCMITTEDRGNKLRGKCKENGVKLIKKYNGKILERVHKGEVDKICHSWSSFKVFRNRLKHILDEYNGMISDIINYEFLDSEFKRNLYKRMNIKVCPYCNTEYIFQLDDGKYLGDIDHVMPKSIYGLFALSLWNLVPSCKKCNQTLKRNISKHILNPTQRGFEHNAIFTISVRDVKALRGESDAFEVDWYISCVHDNELKAQIKNNINVFKLNEQYSKHKERIKDIMRKKYYLDDKFIRECAEVLHIDSREELNYSIYGSGMNFNKFKDEPFSKMIFDLVNT